MSITTSLDRQQDYQYIEEQYEIDSERFSLLGREHAHKTQDETLFKKEFYKIKLSGKKIDLLSSNICNLTLSIIILKAYEKYIDAKLISGLFCFSGTVRKLSNKNNEENEEEDNFVFKFIIDQKIEPIMNKSEEMQFKKFTEKIIKGIKLFSAEEYRYTLLDFAAYAYHNSFSIGFCI